LERKLKNLDKNFYPLCHLNIQANNPLRLLTWLTDWSMNIISNFLKLKMRLMNLIILKNFLSLN